MALRETSAVFAKEIRNLLRDRHILLYSVALPAFLYPAVVFGLVQVAAYVRGLDEQRRLTVQLDDTVTGGAFEKVLSEEERRLVVRTVDPVNADSDAARDVLAPEVGAPDAEALVVLRRARGDGRNGNEITAQVFFSEARSASSTARSRISAALADYRHQRLVSLAKELGQDEQFLTTIKIDDSSFSTGEEVSAEILAMILPIIMIFMTVLGAFYPALDATVGEKERGTLETTLVSPIPRGAIVVGKYGAVSTISFLSFVLNFAGMYITLSHTFASRDMEKVGLGFDTIAVILAGAVLLAAFFSAAMMLVAFLAKSFKEGQAYVSPIYLVSLVPFIVLSDPEMQLTLSTAFVPLVNVALMFRGALSGDADALLVAITLGVSLALSVLALWMAARVIGREDVATGGELRFLDAFRKRPQAARERSTV